MDLYEKSILSEIFAQTTYYRYEWFNAHVCKPKFEIETSLSDKHMVHKMLNCSNVKNRFVSIIQI